jgi:hypothetical protein
LPYIETYRGQIRICSDESGYYCYDRLSRRTSSYSTKEELKDAIRTDSLTYPQGTPFINP